MNIFRNDFSSWTHHLSDTPGVITHTSADIGNSRAFPDIERCQHSIGLFFLDSFRPREPVCAGRSHDRRGLPLDLRLRGRHKRKGQKNKNNRGSNSLHGPNVKLKTR